MIKTLFPLYGEGTLKAFQKNGNYNNFAIDLIQVSSLEIPAFSTDWITYSDYIAVKSVKLYGFKPENIDGCEDNADIIAQRTLVLTMPNNVLTKETRTIDGTAKARYYCLDKYWSTKLDSGIYELVIELYTSDALAVTTLESELFSTAMFSEIIIGQLQCSGASCPDVARFIAPVFTIDVDEIAGSAMTGFVTVTWRLQPAMLFNNLTFNNILFTKDYTEIETQDISLAAGGNTTLTFTCPVGLPKAQYIVEYTSNFGCEGSITFNSVLEEFTLDSHAWDVPVTPVTGWQLVNHEFSVTNTDTNSHVLYLQTQLNNGTPAITETTLTAGETRVFTTIYNVNRTNDNYINCSGDLIFSDKLDLVLPS